MDIRLAQSIWNSNNSTMNNTNNTTNTSHDSSTTTTSSIVNNSNKSTNTTTTSSNNSGDSKCNNIHNININIHDSAGLNSHRGLSLQQFSDLFAYQRNMQMNDLYSHSLGTYQAHPHYYGQGQGHQSLAMHHCHADPIFYNPTVTNSMMSSTTAGMFTLGGQNAPNEYLIYYIAIILLMSSTTAGMFTFGGQNAPNEHLDLLYHNYSLRCTGIRDTNWLIMFKQFLSIYRLRCIHPQNDEKQAGRDCHD